METQAKPTRNPLHGAVLWLLEKVAEQTVGVILATAILWVSSTLGAARLWAYQKSVPLWIFAIVLAPASFGIVAFVRIYLVSSFHVTADPIKSLCCEAQWGDVPAVQVRLDAMFANASKYDVLLMYAYLKGTKPLMHFEKPVHIPPHMAVQEDVLFFCTQPKRAITSRYEVVVIFVDADGRKSRQRLTIMGIPTPTGSASATNAATQKPQ